MSKKPVPPPPPSPMDAKWRIIKNVVVISLAFMLHYTAFNGAANLQSSINAEAGLGTAALAAVYAGLILSNVFLPTILIRWLGCKWTIALSLTTYIPFMAAQMRPTFWTLIPAGLLVGLGQGPLWCAKCTYLFLVSEIYSNITEVSAEALYSRFLGLFFMLFQLNQVWGNLLSSLIISGGDNAAAVTKVNASMIPEVCGASFLPSADAGDALHQQPPHKIRLIACIFIACMAGASILVAVGVDSIRAYEDSKSDARPVGSPLMATLEVMIEPMQLLLIVVDIFMGMVHAFFIADFTVAFVSCSIGTGTVGLIMLTYGLASALGSITTGHLAKHTGRFLMISMALAIHTALYTTLLLWKPHADEQYVMYLISVIWGVSEYMWVIQINALYGILFPGREEAAFSNFRLWHSVGSITAFILSSYVRTSLKTFILFITMFFGYSLYLMVEFR